MNNAAQYRSQAGDYKGALADFDVALGLYKKRFGEDHPDVLALMRNEGIALRHLTRPQETVAMFDSTLAIAQRMYGDDRQMTGSARGKSGR